MKEPVQEQVRYIIIIILCVHHVIQVKYCVNCNYNSFWLLKYIQYNQLFDKVVWTHVFFFCLDLLHVHN